MPESGVPLLPSDDLLTTDEVERVARLFVANGVSKIRLTGGEPTVRKDLLDVVCTLLRSFGLSPPCPSVLISPSQPVSVDCPSPPSA